ncbi:MAG: ABC-type transporter, integral rane subunit [candidate division NC10 bacterium]|nr:ABC-type transporter, integral rane subunit [candidate division NC10 bacterium]
MIKEATAAIPAPRAFLSRSARETLANYAYLLPAAICLGGTVAFPILKAIHMSLYQNVLSRPQDYHFIGLGNYVRMVYDPTFWLTLQNSFVWVFFSVSLQFVLGFLGALLLNANFKGRAFFRTLNLLPWIIPGVVVGLVWEYLYQPNYGPINDILRRVGVLTVPVAWLSDPTLAMASVIFANIWRGIPFFSIMILAGLQAIPDEVYEAATVDGASVTQRFWHITLPMLRPIIVVATATRIIWTFNYADLIFVMTSGGPANATQITSSYTLLTAYTDLDFGYAATLSVILLVIMLIFTACYLKFTKGVESVSG